MNVNGFLSQPVQPYDKPPPCFGADWDKNEPECAGGPDASFAPKPGEDTGGFDAPSGSHVRRQCVWFQSCGARVAAQKNANGTLISAQQVLHRPGPAPAPAPQPRPQPVPSGPQNFAQWLSTSQRTHTQVQQQAAAQQVRPPVQQPQVPVYPQQQYQQQYQQPYATGPVQPSTAWHLNYQMPGYLSEPEVRHPGESLWAVLLREVLRAMGKALGHSVSHFFDSRSFK